MNTAELSPGLEKMFTFISRLKAERFSGRLVFDFHEGGVMNVQTQRTGKCDKWAALQEEFKQRSAGFPPEQ